MFNKFYKENKGDKIWWLDNFDTEGEFVFSFNRIKTFNLFRDYPWKLTEEQKRIFDEEQPFWADYFSDRTEKGKG